MNEEERKKRREEDVHVYVVPYPYFRSFFHHLTFFGVNCLLSPPVTWPSFSFVVCNRKQHFQAVAIK